MKGYTGKLVIRFTATVRSLADLDRRIAKVVAHAESLIGAECWEVTPLVALPGPLPLGFYGVQLCTVGHPGHGRSASSAPPEWRVVETLSEARAVVRDYLQRHAGVTARHWGPDSGRVWDHQGEVVARFTYNLRCWSSRGDREIQVG